MNEKLRRKLMLDKILPEEIRKYSIRQKIAPNLGKFVVQQNEIQVRLSFLIQLRGERYNLIDKEWIKDIEGSTLGKVIKLYQLSASKVSNEIDLLKKLKEYNKIRNNLIHHIMNINSQFNENDLNSHIEFGNKILGTIYDLIMEELKKPIGSYHFPGGYFVKQVKIKIGEEIVVGYEIPMQNAVLVLALGKKGFVMCGYLNIDAAEKMGDCACVVKGVKNVDELLAGKVVALTSDAKKLGIELEMSGKEALEKLV